MSYFDDKDEGIPRHYSVRFTSYADREALDVVLRIDETEGEEAARQWYNGLRAAAGTLSEQPRRNAVLPRESRLMGAEVRRLLYRRTPGSAAYLLYYQLEEGERAEDGPRILIVHVRHGSRRPMTAKDARLLQNPP